MDLPFGLPPRPVPACSDVALAHLRRREDKQAQRRDKKKQIQLAAYSNTRAPRQDFSGTGQGSLQREEDVVAGAVSTCTPQMSALETSAPKASALETSSPQLSAPQPSTNAFARSVPEMLPPLRVAPTKFASRNKYTPSSLQAPPALRLEAVAPTGSVSADNILWPNEALGALGPFPLWPPVAGQFQWSQWEREVFAEAAAYLGNKPHDRRGLVSAELAALDYHLDLQYSVELFSDLTDLSELEEQLVDAQRKSNKWHRKSPQKQLIDIICGYEKLAGKNVLKAQLPENTVVFDHFSFEDAVAQKHGNPDKVKLPGRGRWMLFDGTRPRRASSKDQYDLVYHLPCAFRGTTLDNLEEAMLDWADVAPMETKGKNDFGNCYKEEYAISGRTRIALLWHAIGHRKSNPVVCADVRKTGSAFEGAMTLLTRLELVSAYCMRSLLCIDPLQFGLLGKVYDYRLSHYKSQQAFAALDKKMMWEGREVMFNRWSPRHWDSQDPPRSWACITYVGDFGGAYFEFPQLKLRLKLQPGDVVFF